MTQLANFLAAAPVSHCKSVLLHFQRSSLEGPGKAVEEGTRLWVAATHMGDLDGAPGS